MNIELEKKKKKLLSNRLNIHILARWLNGSTKDFWMEHANKLIRIMIDNASNNKPMIDLIKSWLNGKRVVHNGDSIVREGQL